MFKMFKDTPTEKETLDEQVYILDQIRMIWACQNKLSQAVFQISECMKNIAEGSMLVRQDLDSLADHVVRIAEQQNKLTAHLMRSQNLLENIQSTKLH